MFITYKFYLHHLPPPTKLLFNIKIKLILFYNNIIFKLNFILFKFINFNNNNNLNNFKFINITFFLN